MKYEKSSVKYVYIYISGVHVQSMTGASRNVLMAVNKKKDETNEPPVNPWKKKTKTGGQSLKLC